MGSRGRRYFEGVGRAAGQARWAAICLERDAGASPPTGSTSGIARRSRLDESPLNFINISVGSVCNSTSTFLSSFLPVVTYPFSIVLIGAISVVMLPTLIFTRALVRRWRIFAIVICYVAIFSRRLMQLHSVSRLSYYRYHGSLTISISCFASLFVWS